MRSKFKVKYTNISSVQLKGFVCRFLNHFYFYSRLKIYIYSSQCNAQCKSFGKSRFTKLSEYFYTHNYDVDIARSV